MELEEYIENNIEEVEADFNENCQTVRRELNLEVGFRELWEAARDATGKAFFSDEAKDELLTFWNKHRWFLAQLGAKQAQKEADILIKVVNQNGEEISNIPIKYGTKTSAINTCGYGPISGLVPMLLQPEVREAIMQDEFPLEIVNTQLTHSIGDSMNYVLKIIRDKDPKYFKKLEQKTEMFLDDEA